MSDTIPCEAALMERYVTETMGAYIVYNVYGVACLTTYDRDEALKRARLLDTAERLAQQWE